TIGLIIHKALRKGTILDFCQHGFHIFFDLSVDNAWPGDIVTKFRGIRNGPALFGKATFNHKVNNKFQFVQYLKVGNPWLVASFSENFETCLDEVGCTTVEHSLFTM